MPTLPTTILKLYPSKYLEESVLAATRDALYGWTAERLVTKQTALGQPAFFYIFDHGYPAADAAGLHAFHAAELPYVFGTARRTPPLWPKIPAYDCRSDLVERDARLLDAASRARANRARQISRNGEPTVRRVLTWTSPTQPIAATHLLPGMYELNEAVVCRRRSNGTLPWNWNVGIISPQLPPRTESCQ